MRWRVIDVGALSGDPCAKYVRLLKRAFDIFPPCLPKIIGLVLGDCQQIPTVVPMVVGIDIHFFSEMHIRLLDLSTFGCCAVKKS